jgi:hypothetical protein
LGIWGWLASSEPIIGLETTARPNTDPTADWGVLTAEEGKKSQKGIVPALRTGQTFRIEERHLFVGTS